MISVFLKHYIYEKCINLVFDGLIKTFKKQPEPKYKILNVDKTVENGFERHVYTIKHNGELRKIAIEQNAKTKSILMDMHGFTEEEANNEIARMAAEMIEEEIRIQEVGFEKAMEEKLGHPIPEDGEVIMTNREEGTYEHVNPEDLPQDIKDHLQELKDKYGDDIAMPGEDFSLEFPDKPISPTKDGEFL